MLNGSSDVGPSIPFRRMILTLRDGPGGNDAALLAVMRAYPSISSHEAKFWLSSLGDCTLERPGYSFSPAPPQRCCMLVEDVLGIIFLRVIEADNPYMTPSTPFTAQHALSLVCRSWRQAALNTPSLWRFLSLDCDRLRTAEDLSVRRTYVLESVSRSRERVHHLYVCNFAGSALGLDGFPEFWGEVTTRVLPVCDKLYLVFPDDDCARTARQCPIGINSLLSLVAGCISPRLTAVSITAGYVDKPARARYDLAVPLFTYGTTPSLESLTVNCIRLTPLSSPIYIPNITHFVFCGGEFDEVEQLILGCRATLRCLELLTVRIVTHDIVLREFPLSSLTLSGPSVAFLSCLRGTSLPRLRNIDIAFDEMNHAAQHLDAFVQRHPESPISCLGLRRRSRTGFFSDFTPAIREMTRLQTLALRGGIEPDFFSILADVLTDALAHQLTNLFIKYTGPLDHLASSLLEFLSKKELMTDDWALDNLHLLGPPSASRTPPFDYATTRALNRSVWRGGFTIMGRPADELLESPPYWLSARQTELAGGMAALGLLACSVMLTPELSHQAMYACYILWFALLAKNVFMTFLEERRALSLIARSWLILWQLVLGGQFVYYSAYLVALMYGV
ncbi:hypothetical protein AURDEDRAFT_178468 [Auricularia subglabra TFB-10046 SS5]|uniref:Uncharacterized protein n=1 Tax=Auricularia subglabra (strain TFB-10046 / SS5) TaxID=717982 RepID=J0WJL9_AURST|nr:hypothetical protein AURDEDRAFT_178468 [Auricularia subglabra TFB-10046 SS5]